jgi:hypothetical protein
MRLKTQGSMKRILFNSGKSEEPSHNTEQREHAVYNQIMEDSIYFVDEEDERIVLVDNDIKSSLTMIEVMRGAGIILKKLQSRCDIPSALKLLENNRRAIKVFIVDYELLVAYAASQHEDLSCFVR